MTSKIFIGVGRAGSTLVDWLLLKHGLKPTISMKGQRSSEPYKLKMAIWNCEPLKEYFNSLTEEWDFIKLPCLGGRIPELAALFPNAKFVIMERSDEDMVRSALAAKWGPGYLSYLIDYPYGLEIRMNMEPGASDPRVITEFRGTAYWLLYPKKKFYREIQHQSFHVCEYSYLMGDFEKEVKALFDFLDLELDLELADTTRKHQWQRGRANPSETWRLKRYELSNTEIQFIKNLRLLER